MKIKLLILITTIGLQSSFGQVDSLRDNIWLFGFRVTDSVYTGGSEIKFELGFPDTAFIYWEETSLNVTNASICDQNGDLLFYTNGLNIYNADHDIMENGTNINPGPFRDGTQGRGYILNQGALILPKPNSTSEYLVFHGEQEWGQVGGNAFAQRRIYTSKVRIDENNLDGEVFEKNKSVLEDTLDYGKLTSVRHANGRDWWIIVPELNTAGLYTMLLGPSGLSKPEKQIVGDSALSGIGQAVFSPDGKKYARLNLVGTTIGGNLDIYEFDRCTGVFSNHTTIKYTPEGTAFSGGLAFSPNNRFLYAPSGVYVFQYDLWTDNIEASIDTVAVYDGFVDIAPTTFFLAQLAPDNKIYINVPSSVAYLHIIDQPNLKGDACNVIQHGLKLPRLNYASMPNYPNFRLGALAGSPCDTIVEDPVSVDELLRNGSVEISPNPVQDYFDLVYDFPGMGDRLQLVIYGLDGKVIREQVLSTAQGNLRVDTNDFLSGIYFLTIQAGGRVVYQEKLVKME